jgi:hypothetical protein
MTNSRDRRRLASLATDELVKQFARLAMQQDVCLLENDIAGANRRYRQMRDISDELKARPGDKRRALTSLYDHQNMQVRVNAAKNTLAVAPHAARKQLEAVVASKWQPYAGDAGMCLIALDRGIFKPT